jgi:hypothetical protein
MLVDRTAYLQAGDTLLHLAVYDNDVLLRNTKQDSISFMQRSANGKYLCDEAVNSTAY